MNGKKEEKRDGWNESRMDGLKARKKEGTMNRGWVDERNEGEKEGRMGG